MAQFIPASGKVLDLGCGDGQIARRLTELRPDLQVEGVDVLVRPRVHVPVTAYDGHTLPFKNKSFDFISIVDVLHHTEHPASVLREALRVSRSGVIIKDHLREGVLAGPILRLMDWVGNRGHDVRLPYNYLSRRQWAQVFAEAGLRPTRWAEKLDLYALPLSVLFERKLHFMALLAPKTD